jgi:hypothetical protein
MRKHSLYLLIDIVTMELATSVLLVAKEEPRRRQERWLGSRRLQGYNRRRRSVVTRGA